MSLIETILGFRETKTKRFEYRFYPYLLCIGIGLLLWIMFGAIGSAIDYTKEWILFERLFWWFAFIWTLFYFERRASRMALDHNLQQIDIKFNEMHNLRAFKTLTEELIKEKIKNNKKAKK